MGLSGYSEKSNIQQAYLPKTSISGQNGSMKGPRHEGPTWNFWLFFYCAQIFPICPMWTKIDKKYIVLYLFFTNFCLFTNFYYVKHGIG